MLGSGTSHGVPMIGCECATCRSTDPRDRRSRASILIRLHDGPSVLVDTSPDLRAQALAHGVSRVDAILYTHSHADHVMGLDEVRRFNVLQKSAIPCYGDERTLGDLRRIYSYIFDPTTPQRAAGFRRSSLFRIAGEFSIGPATFVPVPLLHGSRRIFGYRVGTFAYLTDCSAIPEASWPLLERRAHADSGCAARAAASHAFLAGRSARGRGAARRRSAPISRTCVTICRTRRPARGCLPAWSWHMMASRLRSISASTVRVIIHYPDDPRPARWHQPVLALGNFDGMHRGHLKIIERVRRGAEERGRSAVAMTFDPHPSKIVRPDKAPPLLMTNQQKLEALARAGMHGVADRPLHAGAGAVGSGDVRAARARRVAARRGGLGGREFSVRPRSRRQFFAAAQPRRALRVPRGEDRSRPLQGVRRQQHAHPAAGRRRAGGRGGRAARPSLLRSTDRSCTGSIADAGSDFPRRISARENELIPPHGVYATTVTLDGVAYPSVTNIGRRPTFENSRGRVIETHVLDFDRDLYGANAEAGFCAAPARREAVRRSRGAEGADRGRSRRRRASCSIGWACKSYVGHAAVQHARRDRKKSSRRRRTSSSGCTRAA